MAQDPVWSSYLIFKVLRAAIVGLLLSHPLLVAQSQALGFRHPAPSPDGAKICFGYQGDLWIVSAQGGRAERLTVHVGYESYPSWSPDGGRVLYVESRASGQPMQIAIIDAGGSGASIFRLSDAGTDYSHPRLSSNGQYIYFEASTGGASDIYRYDVKSGSVEQLTSDSASDGEPWLR